MQTAFLLPLLLGLPFAVSAQEITRHPIPNSDFPILRAVEIPPEATLVYLSGTVPSATDDAADPNSVEAYGDTTEQTRNVLEKIDATLTELGLSMSDVVKMQVYLVAPDGEAMDFAGFMEGYTEFFGTEAQPNLPTRSVFEVAGLANPGFLVEIEVVAARM
ncbi:RidA family protein [Rubellimicrobium roseum]|uniref:RidA family protein n=1 Tax=Rubellimicrobium roseum TaxID=687525 RepID=A0A5C4N4H9_9RHOB|nr:RidA family protein [Rubellimicrobium roseum]TNC62876.1 hypothetical protein FHG71_20015 [Rubellimicrobium roseum]